MLVLADLFVPDLLVVVRVRWDPLVRAIAVVELLVTRPQGCSSGPAEESVVQVAGGNVGQILDGVDKMGRQV